MNIQLNLSLKDIALRRVVINICSGPVILSSIEKFQINSRNDAFENQWRKIVGDQVSRIMSKLLLPETLKKEIAQIIGLIGLLILRWKVFHEHYLTISEGFGKPILSKICWTYSGMIDYRKTAEALIRRGMLDAVKLYKLACLYCLEDYIPIFWEKLPGEIKSEIYNDKNFSYEAFPQLQFCWPYILNARESRLNCMSKKTYGDRFSFNQGAFEYSARRGNKAATEYFFRKLTEEEKEASLCKVVDQVLYTRFARLFTYPDDFPSESLSEVFFYLLSQMNCEQQMLILKEKLAEALCCFLDWPWQGLFLENVDQIWAFPPEDCCALFDFMWSYFTDSNYYFPELFREFFVLCPMDDRKHFVRVEGRLGAYFERLFDMEDTETVKVILRNIDYTDRVKLLSSSKFFDLYSRFILSGKWHMVKVCIKEAMLSIEDMESLNEGFIWVVRLTDKYGYQSDHIWTRFFQLF